MARLHMNFSLHPPYNAGHEAGQAASTVVQVFSMTQPGMKLSLPTLVAYAQATVPLSQ